MPRTAKKSHESKTSSVGVRELKNSTSAVLRRVRAGESVIITDRHETIAVLVPAGASPRDWRAAAQAMVAAGRASWSGRRHRVSKGGPVVDPPVSDAILEDRR